MASLGFSHLQRIWVGAECDPQSLTADELLEDLNKDPATVSPQI